MASKKNIIKLFKILSRKKIKLCVAESVTGGGFAFEIIKIKNASKIFDYSIVCYNNESKSNFLNISKDIKKYGVVSSEVAKSMALNISKYSKSKKVLALSSTGQAGPNKINQKEKIGTVFIGIHYCNNNFSIKKVIKTNDRVKIINKIIDEMVNIGIKTILD
tara:strand:+ start:1041 stop:1526 length:486 start_codon:yes stop_codon:yes gene_type:complete